MRSLATSAGGGGAMGAPWRGINARIASSATRSSAPSARWPSRTARSKPSTSGSSSSSRATSGASSPPARPNGNTAARQAKAKASSSATPATSTRRPRRPASSMIAFAWPLARAIASNRSDAAPYQGNRREARRQGGGLAVKRRRDLIERDGLGQTDGVRSRGGIEAEAQGAAEGGAHRSRPRPDHSPRRSQGETPPRRRRRRRPAPPRRRRRRARASWSSGPTRGDRHQAAPFPG